MEEFTDDVIESVINDIRSKDITQRFCNVLSSCIFKTLTEPLTFSDCDKLKIDELTDAKRLADEQIQEDLNKESQIDIKPFSNIRSVFETVSFYDDIVTSLLSKDEANCESLDDNVEHSGSKSDASEKNLNLSSSTTELKVYDTDCSFKTGHVDLDMLAIQYSKMNLRQADMFVDNDCVCSKNVASEFHIRPIVRTPLTKSQFQLVNINFYLMLSQFCHCCKKRLNDLSVLNSLTENRQLKSQVVFNNEFSLFRPYVPKKCNAKNTENEADSSLDNSEASKSTELEVTKEPLTSEEKKHDDAALLKQKEEELPLEVLLRLKTQPDLDSPLAAMHRVHQESSDKENRTERQSLVQSPILDTLLENSEVQTLAEKESASSVHVSLPLNENKGNKKKTDLSSKEILDEIYYKYQEAHRNSITAHNKASKQSTKRDERLKISHELPALKEKLDNRRNIASDLTKKGRLVSVEPAKSNDSNKKQVHEDENVLSVDDYVPIGLRGKIKGSSPPIETPQKQREVLLSEDKRLSTRKFAKLLKKEKRRKKKLMRRKAKIELTPPPGVDLDEFLLEQLQSIKKQLMYEDDGVQLNDVTTSNLDATAVIDGQLPSSAESKIGDSVLTVLHTNTDPKQRKVVDCTTIAQDFDSLPEFENKCQSQSTPKRVASDLKTQNWKRPIDPKKSIVHRLRNRSRTPQISRNRFNTNKRIATKSKRQDLGQDINKSDCSRVTENVSINSDKSSHVILISDNESDSGSTNPTALLSRNTLAPGSKDSDCKVYQKSPENRLPAAYKRYRSKSKSPYSRGSLSRRDNVDAVITESHNDSRHSSNDLRSPPQTSPNRYSQRKPRSRSRSPYSKNWNTRDHRRRSPINYDRKRSRSPCIRRRISPPRRRFRSRSKSPQYHKPNYRRQRSGSKSPRSKGSNNLRNFKPALKSPRWQRISADQFDESVLLNVEKAVSPPKENSNTSIATSTRTQGKYSSLISSNYGIKSPLPPRYVNRSRQLPEQYRSGRSNYSNYRFKNRNPRETVHSTREQTVERTLSVHSESDYVEEIKTITVEETYCTLDEDN